MLIFFCQPKVWSMLFQFVFVLFAVLVEELVEVVPVEGDLDVEVHMLVPGLRNSGIVKWITFYIQNKKVFFLQICYNYELVHKMCYCIYDNTTTGQGEGQTGSGPRGEGNETEIGPGVLQKKTFDEGSLFLTSPLTLDNQRNHRSTNIRTWGFIGKS